MDNFAYATTRFVKTHKQARLYSKLLKRPVRVGEAIEAESEPLPPPNSITVDYASPDKK